MGRSMASVWEELKRRNVVRVAFAYVIVAWLILQVGDTLAPALGLSGWVNTVLAFFLILGFPLALFFAWAFELTPEGIKKEKDVDRSESVTHLTGRKLDFLIIGVLIAALGVFAYDKFVNDEAVTDDAAVQPVVAMASDKSIAVLPFVNMSDDPGNEYFSDGISEEILNLLAKIPEMRVTSRSSAFSFKGQNASIPTIAAALNVLYVLEGSVRKSENQLRITAQLIEVGTDTHLWSETYDRELKSVFAIQDEIAAAVVSELKLRLLAPAPKTAEIDPVAYTLFLQARQLRRQHTPESLKQSVALYQQALEIQVDCAACWVDLATSYMAQTNNGLRPFEEGFQSARDAANKALEFDPDFAPAHIVLGFVARNYDIDFKAAAWHFQRSVTLEPTNPDVLGGTGGMLRSLGRTEEAIAITKYQVARDPINSGAYANLGYGYRFSGQLDDSIDAFRAALRLNPGRIVSHYRIGEALLLKGELDAALAEIQKEPDEGWRTIGEALMLHAMGRTAEADDLLKKMMSQEEFALASAYNIAYVLAFRGDVDGAFEWLDKAHEYHDSGLSQVHEEILFANIHDDARWLSFLERLGVSPKQLAAIEFVVTLPE